MAGSEGSGHGRERSNSQNEMILDEKGNTNSKVTAGKPQRNLLRKQNISVVASGKI